MPKTWKEIVGKGVKRVGRRIPKGELEFNLDERMFTTPEVQKILRTTKFSVDAMCQRKKLRFIKMGKDRLFPESWLKEDMLKEAKLGHEDRQ